MSDDATRRYIRDKGHNVVLTTYAEGGKDAYEDATVTTSSSTIKAIRKMYRGGYTREPSGAIPTGDALFFIEDSATFPDDSTTPASQITDDGVDYLVKQVDDQRNGLLTVTVEKKR